MPTTSTGADDLDRGVRTGPRDHRRRRPLAQAEAGRSKPCRLSVAARRPGRPDGPFQVGAQLVRSGQPTGEVVADVGDDRRPGRGGEQGVERGDAPRLGRWDRQPPRDVVQRRLADPADPRLDGVEDRKQQVAARPGLVAAPVDMTVRARIAWAAAPAALRQAEDGVHGGSLGGRRERPDDVEVHRPECSRGRDGRPVGRERRADAAGTEQGPSRVNRLRASPSRCRAPPSRRPSTTGPAGT